MSKLERITIESIDSLDNISRIIYIGKGTIGGSRINPKILILKNPQEKRILKTENNIDQMDKEVFLEYIEEYLANNDLYLADANYRAGKFREIVPKQLKGTFYESK